MISVDSSNLNPSLNSTANLTLNSLSSPKGAHRDTKRIGRGQGSGRGTQAGKGHKGQKARSGGWWDADQNATKRTLWYSYCHWPTSLWGLSQKI